MKTSDSSQPWFVLLLVTWTFGAAFGFSISHYLVTPGSVETVSEAGGMQSSNSDRAAADLSTYARHIFIGIRGTQLSPEMEKFLGEVTPGGIVLSDANLRDGAQVQALTKRIRALARARGDDAPFISLMQPRISSEVLAETLIYSAAELGKQADEREARESGRSHAQISVGAGIDVVMAPVLDLYESSSVFPELLTESFGSDQSLVSRMGLAMAEGLRDGGAIAVAKHFPGYGGAIRAPRGQGLVIAQDIEGLAKTMLPFNDAVRSGIPGMLVAHVAVPALDPDGENRSAALSSNLIGNVLREQWGYDGVLIADDITHGPVRESLPEEQAIVQALAAGCDMVIFLDPNPERILAAVRAIETAVHEGELSWEQLDASTRRMDVWRQWLAQRDTSLLREARERVDVVQRANRERLAVAAAERKAEMDRLAKIEADRRAKKSARLKAEADARAKVQEEARQKAEADLLAKREADRKEKEAIRLKAKAEQLAKIEAELKEKETARLKAVADAKAKKEKEALAKAEAERLAKLEADKKEEARLKAESDRLAKLEAEQRAEENRLKMEALAAAEPEPISSPEVADTKVTLNPFGMTELAHHVRNGQTLGHVAELYGVETSDIIRWNSLDTSAIEAGDELQIYLSPGVARAILEQMPSDAPEPEEIVHVVGSGENLTLIAKMFDTTVRDLALWNQLTDSHLEPGQKLTLFVPPLSEAEQTEYVIHRVARGDTLTLIAERYGTNNTNLIRLNNLKNANHIWVGQRLKVPAP